MNIYKETSLPTTLESNSIYLIAPNETNKYVDIYVTGKNGDIVRRTIKESDVLDIVNENGGGGGGSYNFEVKELDLYNEANKIFSTMKITPDTDNIITGNTSVGTISSSNNTMGGYFEARSGKITITIDCTIPSSRLFVNKEFEPTSVINIDNSITDNLFGAAYVGSFLMVIVGTFAKSTQISIPPEKIGVTEDITFEILNNVINIYHRGEKIGSHTNIDSYYPFWQMANNQIVPDNYTTSFDLSQSLVSIEYKLPSDSKDGDIYHITSEGELFNKSLLIDDYITVYANKTNITVLRLPPIQEDKLTKQEIPYKIFYMGDDTFRRVKVYYDTELKAVCIIGSFYLTGEIIINEQNTLFEIDVSKISNSFVLNPTTVLCSYMKNGVYVTIPLIPFYEQETGILQLKIQGFDYMGTYELTSFITQIVLY